MIEGIGLKECGDACFEISCAAMSYDDSTKLCELSDSSQIVYTNKDASCNRTKNVYLTSEARDSKPDLKVELVRLFDSCMYPLFLWSTFQFFAILYLHVSLVKQSARPMTLETLKTGQNTKYQYCTISLSWYKAY